MGNGSRKKISKKTTNSTHYTSIMNFGGEEARWRLSSVVEYPALSRIGLIKRERIRITSGLKGV